MSPWWEGSCLLTWQWCPRQLHPVLVSVECVNLHDGGSHWVGGEVLGGREMHQAPFPPPAARPHYSGDLGDHSPLASQEPVPETNSTGRSQQRKRGEPFSAPAWPHPALTSREEGASQARLCHLWGPSDRPLPAQFPSLAARVRQGDTDIDWQRKQVCREMGTQQPEGGVPRTWPGRA